MTATTVTADVTQADIDRALESFVSGTRIQFCCPVQRALQRTTDRVAVTYRWTWHLAQQTSGKTVVLATKGVELPESAIAFIARFDTWAKAVVAALKFDPNLPLGDARDVVKDPAPRPFRFDVALPTEPIREAKA